MIVKITNVPPNLRVLRPNIKEGDEFKVFAEGINPGNKLKCYLVENKKVPIIAVYPSEIEIIKE